MNGVLARAIFGCETPNARRGFCGCRYEQGFVVGHGVGLLFGSSQQTDTHWSPETKTVAVLVSVVPDPIPAVGPVGELLQATAPRSRPS
jgi:hypothetical protein